MLLRTRVLWLIYLNLSAILASSCDEEKSCGSCISHAEERCLWCSLKDLPTEEPRCKSSKNLDKTVWCKGEGYDPENSQDYSKNNNATDLQFTPTYIKAKLRPNIPINFTMKFRPAKDQPLDVYLLLDNSGSMSSLQSELSKIAVHLQARLTNISNNVHMGVGTFIEKPAKPYTVSRLDTYSFKNDLPLTSNMTLLSQTLAEIKSAKNSDNPESGLDALMQVMVCHEIGWRPKARRMIVYTSDETFHICGDGKLLGIIKPNDMKCHLDNNIHNGSLEYDYPSPGRLDKVATDKDISIIFVIKSKYGSTLNTYKQLAKQIKNAQVTEMEKDNDIANIIIESYKTLKSSVLINYDRLPNVNLKLSPDCSMIRNDKCVLGLKEGITINGSLTLTRCIEGKDKAKMLVGAMGLQPKEKLTIEIDQLCNCECEYKGNASAPECNNNGTYQCGICACNDDRAGDKCECDKSSTQKCDDKFCNGRGQCICGQCQCHPGFGGTYCMLSDTDCKAFEGKLCAGHGDCVKSKCICYKGYEVLDDCSCSSDTSSCFPPETTDTQPCSNNGECKCDKCVCNKEYSGDFCEYCVECEKKTCKDFKEYTQCVFSKNKTICDEEFNELPKEIDTAMVTEKDFDSVKKQVSLTCKITFDNGSAINSRYGFQPETNKWILEIQKELEDPPKANIWVPIGAVIGSILLGGLIILLIWKFAVDYLDKKEFEKFKAEASSAGFNVSLQNPTYIDPVVVFRNPNYSKNE